MSLPNIPPAESTRRLTLVEALRDATQEYEFVYDEALVGAVQNWLDHQRSLAYSVYGSTGQRLIDDLKRAAEASL